ncbi:MAG: alanine--tRNA ligase [Elusimicrobiota bacterium]
MKDSVIRKKFKKYFEKKGHKWYSSIPIVPPDDPTMLFTTAGMVQFKKKLLGKKGKITRAASIQRCLRTTDIDEVGKTSRHLTFFEMYGNFSFGDYFKQDAIKWAWEFLTEIIGIKKERLHASVYKEDKEAYKIWEKYVPESKIHRLGEKDNFWRMGETGPCGPCSEILYDRGVDTGCGRKDCSVGCECDRFIEVWNLVFTQFDRQKDGTLKELPKKNIDTGMGLERLDQVVNSKTSVFDTELINPLIDKVKREASGFNLSSARIIADHARAVTFLIGEGISPSNEGRGYVLRRLIRRALREGRKIGWDEPLLWQYTSMVVDIMSEYYPFLLKRANHIANVCKMEEAAFLDTLENALRILDRYIRKLEKKGENILEAKDIFKLYDTYGLPADITKNIVEEKGYKVDLEGFERMYNERTKQTEWEKKEEVESYWDEVKDVSETKFTGYDKIKINADVLKVTKDKKAVVLDRTSMYPEAGGQVSDKGVIKGKQGNFIVNEVFKEDSVIIHKGELKGHIQEGEDVVVEVDRERRKAIERNHTATHILQSVLREVLGEHIQQNGSLVSPERLRFDFTHTEPVNEKELKIIEEKANDIILDDNIISVEITGRKEAEEKGALAFFGEKYGEDVRVVKIVSPRGKEISMELCGGTHMQRTSEIGLFKIISETGIAAGVRRIEAVTGKNAIDYIDREEDILKEISKMVNSPKEKVKDRIKKLKKEIKDKEKKINKLENKIAAGGAGEDIVEEKIGDIKFKIKDFGESGQGIMRAWVDSQVLGKNVAALATGVKDKRATMVLKISSSLAYKMDAKKIISEAAKKIGGGGGGRKEMAQGGGANPEKMSEAIEVIRKNIKSARSSAG